MENVKVESAKTYYHGFVLSEQELRRIIETCDDQYKKLGNNTPTYNYVVKFKNGVIAQTESLDYIFKLENSGNTLISKLEIRSSSSNDDNLINITFRDVDSMEESGIFSIKHSITGLTRDWVFVTNSLLEERVAKIKRWVPNQLFKGLNSLFFTMILIIGFAFIQGLTSSYVKTEKNENFVRGLNNIDSLVKSGMQYNPTTIIIHIEKMKLEREFSKASFFSKENYGIFGIAGFFCISILILIFFVKYYPSYTFCWGDNLGVFEKKETTRKVVMSIITGTIILGIIVNLLSNYIWIKM